MKESDANQVDNTQLNQTYGLRRDMILNGDKPEFSPLAENNEKPKLFSKQKPDTRPKYLKTDIDKVIDITFNDLRSAYQEIDRLNDEINGLKDTNTNTNAKLQASQNNAKIKDTDESTLKQVEASMQNISKMVARFKQQHEQDIKKMQSDQQQINNLNSQLAQLQEKLSNAISEDEYNQAKEQIDNLQAQVKEYQKDYQDLSDDVNDVLDSLKSQFADLTVSDDTENNA